MSTVKLQIPIDSATRDALAVKAKNLGFDSIQAYFRVWAKAEVDGRSLNFNEEPVVLSKKAIKRYQKMMNDEKNFSKPFDNVDDLMKDLMNETDPSS